MVHFKLLDFFFISVLACDVNRSIQWHYTAVLLKAQVCSFLSYTSKSKKISSFWPKDHVKEYMCLKTRLADRHHTPYCTTKLEKAHKLWITQALPLTLFIILIFCMGIAIFLNTIHSKLPSLLILACLQHSFNSISFYFILICIYNIIEEFMLPGKDCFFELIGNPIRSFYCSFSP